MSTFEIELAYAHEQQVKAHEWRVIATPRKASGLLYQILFGGETTENLEELRGWTAEGLDLVIELLPERLARPEWTFTLQIRGNDTSGGWKTISKLYPIMIEQRYDRVRAMREVRSLAESAPPSAGLTAEEYAEYARDVRNAYREISQHAREGHPSPSTTRIFSHI